MALYFRQTCPTCGRPAENDDKTKSYVHADRGIKFDHAVGRPVVTKLGEG